MTQWQRWAADGRERPRSELKSDKPDVRCFCGLELSPTTRDRHNSRCLSGDGADAVGHFENTVLQTESSISPTIPMTESLRSMSELQQLRFDLWGDKLSKIARTVSDRVVEPREKIHHGGGGLNEPPTLLYKESSRPWL
jgi:hypothetical protein